MTILVQIGNRLALSNRLVFSIDCSVPSYGLNQYQDRIVGQFARILEVSLINQGVLVGEIALVGEGATIDECDLIDEGIFIGKASLVDEAACIGKGDARQNLLL